MVPELANEPRENDKSSKRALADLRSAFRGVTNRIDGLEYAVKENDSKQKNIDKRTGWREGNWHCLENESIKRLSVTVWREIKGKRVWRSPSRSWLRVKGTKLSGLKSRLSRGS